MSRLLETDTITEVALYAPKRPRRARLTPKQYPRTSRKKSSANRRIKPKSISKLKKELEALQKQLVIKTYGRDCYTCNQKDLQGANCQLGHVPWPRSDLATPAKYDIRFTRIQCFRDNIHLGGCGAIALQRMIDEGIDVISLRKWSEDLKGKTVPRAWFEEKIHHYKTLLSEKNEPGVWK